MKVYGYYLILMLLPFAIFYKVFYFPGCMLFDPVDEVGHIFFNLQVALDQIKNGIFPQINLYNNFGTRLLGDSITTLMAPQTLTFLFFESPLASTINKFIIFSVTPILVFIYFKKYVSSVVSLLFSIVSCFSYGLLWHMSHHHYQAVFSIFLFNLISLERYTESPSKKSLAQCFMAIFLILSGTNYNLAIIILAMLFSYFLLRYRGYYLSGLPLIFILLGVGIIFFPDIFSFLEMVTTSKRVEQGYGPGSFPSIINVFKGLLWGGSIWPGQLPDHFGKSFLVPLPIFLLALWGAIKNRTLSIFRVSAILGFGVLFVVLFLACCYPLWWKIPLLASTDISRFLWLSHFFLLLLAAKAVDPFSKNKAILGVVAVVLFFSYRPTLLSVVTFGKECTCKQGNYYCEKKYSEYPLQSLLQTLNAEKNVGRIAHQSPSILMQDFKLASLGYYTGNGRSVLIDKNFGEKLQSLELIKVDQKPFAYHFFYKEQTRSYSDFGFQYLIVPQNNFIKSVDWMKIKCEQGVLNFLENKLETYCLIKNRYYRGLVQDATYEIFDNRIIIQNIKKPELIVAFKYDRGWQASSNGDVLQVLPDENYLMRIKIPEKVSSIVLKYELFSNKFYFICIFFGLFTIALAFKIHSKTIKANRIMQIVK